MSTKVMSTKIDDLPDTTIPREIQQNLTDLEDEIIQRQEDYNYIDPNQSNVKANIKKKVHFADEYNNTESIWSKLRSEINEENALLLVIFVIATSGNSFGDYASKIPYLGNYLGNNDNTIFKAIFLFIAFILLKIFVLPKLSI